MTISGWNKKYKEIITEFGYDKKKDQNSAKILDSLLKKRVSTEKLRHLIEDQPVFVIGAGPSLIFSIPFLKKFKKITKIVADSAIKTFVENGISPDIVVTDLDGDAKSIKKVGRKGAIMVTHAHGDNIEKLNMVLQFENCIGTTQTRKFGKIYNFGGFTDGDRAVFLASYFKAKKIFLFGMDFGTEIGQYSKPMVNKKIKLKKLRRGKKLLEWLASRKKMELYTTSKPIKGFKKIKYKDLEKHLSS